MKRGFITVILVLLLLALAGVNVLAQTPGVTGLATVESDLGFDETVDRLQQEIQAKGLLLVTTVDHSANAATVDMDLRPTRLIVFGNPNLGTQLMQDERTVAIDLPQKMLVWEDTGGQVNVSYNEAAYLRERHGLDASDQVLSTVSNALAGLADSVTVAEPTAPAPLPTTGAHKLRIPWLPIAGGAFILGLALWAVRRRAATLLLLAALPLLGLALSSANVAAQAGATGLITVDSPYSVEETMDRLQRTMRDRGLTIMTTVNHTENAANVGMELRPTQLVVFGNPQLGTPLMQAGQTMAIDLPQKMLVWEDAEGIVHLSYNDPQYLADRHNIVGQEDLLDRVSNALSGLAQAATAQ